MTILHRYILLKEEREASPGMWVCIEQLPQYCSLFLHPAPNLHKQKGIFHSLITQEARVIIWPLAIKSEMPCDLISYFSSIYLNILLQTIIFIWIYILTCFPLVCDNVRLYEAQYYYCHQV